MRQNCDGRQAHAVYNASEEEGKTKVFVDTERSPGVTLGETMGPISRRNLIKRALAVPAAGILGGKVAPAGDLNSISVNSDAPVTKTLPGCGVFVAMRDATADHYSIEADWEEAHPRLVQHAAEMGRTRSPGDFNLVRDYGNYWTAKSKNPGDMQIRRNITTACLLPQFSHENCEREAKNYKMLQAALQTMLETLGVEYLYADYLRDWSSKKGVPLPWS